MVSPRRDHMTVVVLDATGDPQVLGGKAVYKWNESTATWLLLAKENADTLTFARESKIISNDSVQASYVPANGVIWDVYVELENNVIAQVESSINGSVITIAPDTAGQFDGKRLNFKYAYGTMTQQLDAAMQTHLNASDPHPQYTTASEVASAISNHEAAADPHPQYTTEAEAAAAAPVQSVAGRTGAVWLEKADVGLGNVDNTADLDKPMSTATQTALNAKADASVVGDIAAALTAINGA